MRTDLFQDRKCVHVKLDKDVHASLRGKLFKHNLSMQEIFDEFAKAVVTDDPRAVKLIEAMITRKTNAILQGLSLRKKRSDERINELDQDALYSMIEAKGNDEDEVD